MQKIVPSQHRYFAQKMFDDCPGAKLYFIPEGAERTSGSGGILFICDEWWEGAQSPLEKTMSTMRGVAFTGCK